MDKYYLINDIVQNFPFISIILSLFTGILCAAVKPKKAMGICFFNLIICFALSLATLIYCINNGDYYVYMMGHFPAPFGN